MKNEQTLEIEISFKHCPTCESPKPHLHPAVQFEGEVSICPDPFHGDKVTEKEAA